jgi:predicted lactoylglutathione lyase
MSEIAAAFSHLNLIVSDMGATVAFYRRLGLAIETSPDGVHSSADLPGGLQIEWDTAEFAAIWDSGSRGPGSGGVIICFAVGTRQEVDDLYGELTAAGYRGHQLPYDACWGSRYAMVDDPDGYPVGLMSPQEDAHKYWPPQQAPPIDPVG